MNEVNDECNLVTFNYMPIQFEVAEKEKVLMQATKEGTMLLMSEIFACQYEMTDVGPAAILSKERTKFPREKRIPDTKCETKWEIYAKEKRIRKRKRERLEWSETERRYVPTWGYQSVQGGIEEQGFVEVRNGQGRDLDPYIMVSMIYMCICEDVMLC